MNLKSTRIWLMLAAIAAMAGVATERAVRARPPASPAAAAVLVRTEAAQSREVTVYVKAVGTVTPTHTVVVRPQVSGILTSLQVREGQPVKAGALIATLDDRALRAQVLTAQGNLQRDQAMLDHARNEWQRLQQMLAIGSTTQQQVDSQAALVQQYLGSCTADRGSLENLQVQLGYTRITAPISGLSGLRAVDVGNLVQAGDPAGILTLTTESPISVKFALADDALAQLLDAQRRGTVVVEVLDRAERALESGQLDAIDNRSDTTTGTVMVRASFANAQGTLFPNQFVNVRVQVDRLTSIVVPTRAIQHGSKGDYIFVAEQGHARRRHILSGPVAGQDTALLADADGHVLSAGTAVIVDGIDALDDGMAIRTAPEAGTAP